MKIQELCILNALFRPQLPEKLSTALTEHGLDGFKIEQLLEALPGLTYDDFLLLPGHIYFSPQVIKSRSLSAYSKTHFFIINIIPT